jgi:hypothetical protein
LEDVEIGLRHTLTMPEPQPSTPFGRPGQGVAPRQTVRPPQRRLIQPPPNQNRRPNTRSTRPPNR